MDTLAAEITELFHRELENAGLLGKHLKAKNDAEREKVIRQGRILFRQTVENVNRGRTKRTSTPSVLKGMAELRGELVLFTKPPIFKRFPKASFRSLLRIDGDKIIEQISGDISVLKIYYCDRSPVSQISQDLDVNKTFANRFIKKFLEIAANELREKSAFKLAGFGKFEVVERKARIGINPRTGKRIRIPKKRVVKFRPYEKLREEAARSPSSKKTEKSTGVKSKSTKK